MTNKSKIFAGLSIITLAAGALSAPAIAQENPHAGCAPVVQPGATATWNYMQSTVDYVYGPIANGMVVVTDGATFDEANRGPLTFGINGINATSHTNFTLPLQGGFNLYGHKDAEGNWAMETMVSDLKIEVGDGVGYVVLDYATPAMGAVEEDVRVATFPIESPIDVSKPVSFTAMTSLTDVPEALDLFLKMKQAGTEMSPLTLNFEVKMECENPGGEEPGGEEPGGEEPGGEEPGGEEPGGEEPGGEEPGGEEPGDHDGHGHGGHDGHGHGGHHGGSSGSSDMSGAALPAILGVGAVAALAGMAGSSASAHVPAPAPAPAPAVDPAPAAAHVPTGRLADTGVSGVDMAVMLGLLAFVIGGSILVVRRRQF